MTPTRKRRFFMLAVVLTALSGTSAQASPEQNAVDDNYARVKRAIDNTGLNSVASIDHARLAAAEGVEMPPSRVQIFSDPSVNASIMKNNVRAGLDLPFRVLSYDQDGTAQVVYTNADFLKIRHGVKDEKALNDFEKSITNVVDDDNARAATTKGLSKDFGIIEISSTLSVDQTVTNLTEIVKAQVDTIWFGKIDFSAEAASQGVELSDAVLLLFGGPAPGGIAMADYPAIGLDAFCQKLLVYAGKNGGSVLLFNDIAAFAELYYGSSAKPHHALNDRLTATFQKALQK